MEFISSPYTHNHHSTRQIMMRIVLATLPGIVAQWYFFGYGNLIQVTLAILTSWSTESAILYMRRQVIFVNLSDHSALLTALLLGISFPPVAPWWLIVIGTAFAIVFAKQLYGGLGQNPFNPAMIGYVVILISFPEQITNSWLPSKIFQGVTLSFSDTINIIFRYHTLAGLTLQQLQTNIDGISQATPLDNFKAGLRVEDNMEQILVWPVFDSSTVSSDWKWINIAYLLGGLFLLLTNSIRWHIPISFLSSLAIFSTLGWVFSSSILASPLTHLFSGGTMLGAFFIATDPVTSATTNKGRLFFGILIGFLVWIIRSFSNYSDGVAFSVLLANICVPLIDHYTKPRVYGHRKE